VNFEFLLNLDEPLSLSSIADEGGDRLRAVVCIGGHKPLPREILSKSAEEIANTPIEFTDAPYFELIWERYFMFSVRDEGSAAYRAHEAFEGTGVRRFSKSWFLDNAGLLSNSTLALRGKITHFGLCSLNHIVDVLAYDEPQVNDLGRRKLSPRVPRQAPVPAPAPVTLPEGQDPSQP
jgi:hypothetical protein